VWYSVTGEDVKDNLQNYVQGRAKSKS